FYQKAIQEDPSYAEAYAGLAAATAILGQVPNDGLAPRDAKPKAREAAQHALQLDPRLAEAHAVLGNVAMSYDWDLATAEKELQQSIALNPNDPGAHEWYAHLLIVEGRNAEALAEARRALDLSLSRRSFTPCWRKLITSAGTTTQPSRRPSKWSSCIPIFLLHNSDWARRIARRRCIRRP